MCSQGILIRASGLKIVTASPFQHSPHMLGSTNINEPPILWWSRFLEGRFTILQDDPALYPHTCLGPVTFMRTGVTKWAKQCLAWGSTRHTVKAIKQFVSLINKHSRSHVLTAERPWGGGGRQNCKSCCIHVSESDTSLPADIRVEIPAATIWLMSCALLLSVLWKMEALHCVYVDVSSHFSWFRMVCGTHHTNAGAPHNVKTDVHSVPFNKKKKKEILG